MSQTAKPTYTILSPEQHRGLRRAAVDDYRFAAAIAVAPLAGPEVLEAAKTLPVVFLGTDNPVPHAVLGLTADRNALIGADGRWASGMYVPASLRHYPFALVDGKPSDEGPTVALAADLSATGVWAAEGSTVGFALFDGQGKHTEYATSMIRFIAQLRGDLAATRTAMQAIVDAGLLVQRQLRVGGAPQGDASGTTYPAPTVIGFFGVDNEKLKALPDATLAAWARNGVLALIHAHLGSMGCFAGLAPKAAREAA